LKSTSARIVRPIIADPPRITSAARRVSVQGVVRPEAVKLLDVAPWLGEGLEGEELEAARRELVVACASFQPGPWKWPGRDPKIGFLILRGRIARGLHLKDAPAHGIEILGEGDLMRPWTFRGATAPIPSQTDWKVMARLDLAVLDTSFVRGMSRWPELGINLLELSIERTRTLSYFLAARQVSRLEGRILLTLWQLADRWGHVTADGVVLELPKLTHEVLARMIAARRPSVTTGIRHLRELGLLEVKPGGRWVLHGDPVESVRTVHDRIDEPGGSQA
jgi:hypothetical protein